MDGETLNIENEQLNDDMDKYIEEYEKEHGKIYMNMCCNNKQDIEVWESLPLTDNQRKYIIIKVLDSTI